VILILLFLSGNFPQLSKIEKEQAMAENNARHYGGYRRLLTFFYQKDCKTILTVARNIRNKKKFILHKKRRKNED
jgi:hypothetical protein